MKGRNWAGRGPSHTRLLHLPNLSCRCFLPLCELVISGCRYVNVTSWGGGRGAGHGSGSNLMIPGRGGAVCSACEGARLYVVVTVFSWRAVMQLKVCPVGRSIRKAPFLAESAEVTSLGKFPSW